MDLFEFKVTRNHRFYRIKTRFPHRQVTGRPDNQAHSPDGHRGRQGYGWARLGRFMGKSAKFRGASPASDVWLPERRVWNIWTLGIRTRTLCNIYICISLLMLFLSLFYTHDISKKLSRAWRSQEPEKIMLVLLEEPCPWDSRSDTIILLGAPCSECPRSLKYGTSPRNILKTEELHIQKLDCCTWLRGSIADHWYETSSWRK